MKKRKLFVDCNDFRTLLYTPGGYSTKFYTGRLCTEVQPLNLLYSILGKKGTPFVYLLIENGNPIHYCKCTLFRNG